MLRRSVNITWLAALLFALAVPGASAQTCEFRLGFKALADMIPEVVGQCTENEHHSPATGDALQATTGGLLVWRNSDNWTAFTDGATTWINGPFGLESRLNDERFAWEQEMAVQQPAPAPPLVAGEGKLFIGTAASGGALVLDVVNRAGLESYRGEVTIEGVTALGENLRIVRQGVMGFTIETLPFGRYTVAYEASYVQLGAGGTRTPVQVPRQVTTVVIGPDTPEARWEPIVRAA